MNPIDFGAVSIEMPVLVYMDGSLSADPGLGLKVDRVNFVDERTMLCRAGPNSQVSGWILESDGNFRELHFVAIRRNWARPFRIFWNLVLAEYSVAPPREITVGELNDRARKIKDSYPDAPLAADLRRFLKGFPSEKFVTREMLQAWPL